MGSMNNQKGSVLLALIIMMPFFIFIVATYMQLAVNNYFISRTDQYRTHAQFAADAGIDAALEEINLDNEWAGSGSEVEVHSGDSSVKTKYITVVNPGADDDHKLLTSIGRTFSPASSSTPDSEVTIEVTLRATRSGNFSIVTGVGGLYLSNQAKVLGGDVFVNGELVMTGSSQVGLSNSSVNLKVAHQNCPIASDPTHNTEYPRICNPGENGQPISVSNPAWIYGKVYANNQADGSRMSDGGSPGLISSSGVNTQPLPPHVRQDQTDNITVTRSGADASCTTNGGTKTWAANTKIEGNVRIDKDCSVIVEGDVWIAKNTSGTQLGNFSMTHSKAKLKINEGVTTPPKIMIDGQVTEFKNGSSVISNSDGVGAFVISYWTTAACYPDCTDVTGSELYETRDEVAITMNQSSNGPDTIFYARWGKVLIENSGNIGALVGQTVELQNSGTITFGTSLSGDANVFWLIDGYRRAS